MESPKFSYTKEAVLNIAEQIVVGVKRTYVEQAGELFVVISMLDCAGQYQTEVFRCLSSERIDWNPLYTSFSAGRFSLAENHTRILNLIADGQICLSFLQHSFKIPETFWQLPADMLDEHPNKGGL